MENEFIYQLGKKLIFYASYNEMYEISEGYTQFSTEDSIAEKPKDIIKSLYKFRHRAMIIYTILGMFCISNLWLFTYLETHRQLPFFLQYVLPFFLSILFPFVVFITIGKKIVLLSSLYFGLCSSYIMICTLFQVKAIESQLSSMEVYLRNIKIVLVCYFVAMLSSIVWLIILNKEGFLE